jgi:Methyltransferase domain
MTNTGSTDKITGNIKANPNPLPFGQGCVLIAWETNDHAGGEVRVSTSPGTERLVSKGKGSGQMEIPWITDSSTYDFRLYGASQPGTPIDSVKVRRDLGSAPMILHELATEAMQGNVDINDISRFIAAVMPRCLHSKRFHEIFPLWEQHGFHVTPVHFYQPIPDTRSLPENLWERPSKLVGIDMNEPTQLDLLQRRFPKFRDEYEQLPTEPIQKPGRFYLNNGLFGGLDALVAYCMVRHFQPRSIVEIGSGFSSLVLGEALAKNNNPNLLCIDPSPQDFVRHGFPGLSSLIEKKVQDVDFDFFSQLNPNDILFIDSSHTVKIGGDVNYLFLEVLPRLKPGVIVHIHDIFLPFDYRRDWVMEQFRFWTEQYLLQAFLSFNSKFEVLMVSSYLNHFRLQDLQTTFPTLQSWRGGSLWMRPKLPTDLLDSSIRVGEQH